MRHKWKENTKDKRSRYNKECSICGSEKIVSPWNIQEITYKKEGREYKKLPQCNN